VIQDIADRQNIPVKFLEQILLTLKREGFVRSRKGPGGGYHLAMPPREITLGAVVRSIDGPLAPISCVSVSGYMECGCPEPETCGLRTAWKEARDALASVLDNISFFDILERQTNLQSEHNKIFDFTI
jgi:Rrf2 family protein